MEFLDAERTVALLAAFCRVEQLLFTTVGAWAPSTEDAAARIAVVELSDHAAWRAQRWHELLPTAPPGADALLVATRADLEFATGLASAAGSSDAGRFAVLAKVALPMVRGALDGFLDATASSVAHGPARRIAAIARTDVEADLDLALGILERVATDPASRAEAVRATADVAGSVARSGGPLSS